jgi:hypothetical protein
MPGTALLLSELISKGQQCIDGTQIHDFTITSLEHFSASSQHSVLDLGLAFFKSFPLEVPHHVGIKVFVHKLGDSQLLFEDAYYGTEPLGLGVVCAAVEVVLSL